MNRLASPITEIRDHYDVVVIGSGYGGSIAASRMARAGKSVCLLERGKEFVPGEFPDTQGEALCEFQIDLPHEHKGSKSGLYDFRVNDDINVFVGCGLGGTSLVNANVSLRAEKRVFDDPRWPRDLAADFETLLEDGYCRAETMLKPTPYPTDQPALKKLDALQKSAEFMGEGEKCYRPPINVTFEDGVNHVGVDQNACVGCGDCVSGCNYGAKNTTAMNYLPDARNFGAEIFTETSVRHLERKENGWVIHFDILESGREKFGAPSLAVSADVIFLGAGTLGSTEILLRSKKNGLPLSDSLGRRFTGNGDFLGFAYNNDEEINGIGFGHRPPEDRDPVGPCITGIIDRRDTETLNDGMVIEEGSMPGALAPILPGALSGTARLFGEDTDEGAWDYIKEKGRQAVSFIRGAYHGAVKNTQTFLVMAHEEGAGEMDLEDDRLRVNWPGVGSQHGFQNIKNALTEATRALGGTYLSSPTWNKIMGHDLVTVHPLGGCTMGDSAADSVVNHKGQAFAGPGSEEVYENLYVCDGAVIPRSLGVNPLLTISALAERCVFLAANDRGWTIDYELPSQPSEPPPEVKPGIQFTETMRGYLSLDELEDFEKAEADGKSKDQKFEFTLSVISDDVEEMLNNPEHRAKMIGTATVPALSLDPLTATDGEFQLLVKDPDRPNRRLMVYRMTLTATDGKAYFFHGFKLIRNDKPFRFELWSDTTTLFIAVHNGDDESAPIVAKGILKIPAKDFLRQMTTMRVTHCDKSFERLKYLSQFGGFFAGTLFDTYGGVAARYDSFDPDAPPRKKRPLRTPAPQIVDLRTDDGVDLRLTRYQAGSKGPVMLVHGLGVSSRIFNIDTIDTNLVEFLCAHDYDVWCLDFRASIELPASSGQFSGDDIAKYDYPAAVRKILEVTGKPDLQAVVHCFGSSTFFMSMLAGLEGVRSFACSQIALHVESPLLTKLKTGLHVPSFLKAIGVDSLNAYVDKNADWKNKLFDTALRLYPTQFEEHCNNPVCHRIAFMYAPLYEHDQLNEATHSAMHEMFGIANMESFQHIAITARKKHLVSLEGEEIYLPFLDRLNLPITFIHGAENACFNPESTKLSYDLLRNEFGDAHYSRHVIPDYGHIDCIFGKNAHRDVFPHLVDHLENS